MKNIKSNMFIISLLMTSGILYLLWALVLPFNQAPDEYQRFDVANFIFKYHELPVAGDTRLDYGAYGVTYATMPHLPYILGAALMIAAKFLFNIENVYLVHRLLSVLSGVISVYLVFKICGELKLETKLKYFVTTIFAFVPQYAFVNAYVNQDSFSICVNLFIVYCWFICVKKDWDTKSLILLGFGIGICLLTYLNGYIVIPLTGILFIFACRKKPIKVIAKNSLIMILVVLAVSGWWFVRNYTLYEGDFLGLSTNTSLSEKLAVEELKPSNRMTYYKQGISIIDMLFSHNWLNTSYRSFWAAFGYMDLWLDEKYYSYLFILQLLALLGVVLTCKNKISMVLQNGSGIRGLFGKNIYYILIFLLIPLSFALSIYYSYFSDFQAQGRYLFTALFPIILFTGIGLYKLIRRKYIGVIFFAFSISMFILNIYCLYKLIIPAYYKI